MSEKKHPLTVCTVCGKYGKQLSFVAQQCSEKVNGKRCKGVWGSALGIDDWEQCSYCDGKGCDACQLSGWLYVRKN